MERTAKLKRLADKVQAARIARARALSVAAGLSGDYLGTQPHNAMVSYRAGHPWRGVNYQKVKECLHVLSLPSPHRFVDQFWSRRYNEAVPEYRGMN